MGALDNEALVQALRRYVIACGGDPSSSTPDAVIAERDIEQAIDTYAGERRQQAWSCDGCGSQEVSPE